MSDTEPVPCALVIRFTAFNQADVQAVRRMAHYAVGSSKDASALLCTADVLDALNETLARSCGAPE